MVCFCDWTMTTNKVGVLHLTSYLIFFSNLDFFVLFYIHLQMSPQRCEKEFAQGCISRSAGTRNSNPILSECKVHGFHIISCSTALHRIKSQDRGFSLFAKDPIRSSTWRRCGRVTDHICSLHTSLHSCPCAFHCQ